MRHPLRAPSKKERLHRIEQKTGWDLIFRQTAPVPWPGAEVVELNAWDVGKDNFAQLDPETLELLHAYHLRCILGGGDRALCRGCGVALVPHPSTTSTTP